MKVDVNLWLHAEASVRQQRFWKSTDDAKLASPDVFSSTRESALDERGLASAALSARRRWRQWTRSTRSLWLLSALASKLLVRALLLHCGETAADGRATVISSARTRR